MTVLRLSCQIFLCVLIVAATYASGHAFISHQWDVAAGYGGLMLSASHILIMLWAWRSSPAGRHTYRRTKQEAVNDRDDRS